MVMQVRMVPVESVFMRFPRMVRDLAAKLDKQVDLHIQGEDTELDRTVVEALGDPLVHLIRNALDHGLETPEQREAAGKGSVGTLQITAEHAGGDVVITVRDDGRGVNARKVAEIAAKRGLIEESEIEDVDVEAAIELLFAPGFSTAEVATDVSGRGVGMDAVRNMVAQPGRRRLDEVGAGRGLVRHAAPAADAGDPAGAAGGRRRRAVRAAARPRRAGDPDRRLQPALGRRRSTPSRCATGSCRCTTSARAWATRRSTRPWPTRSSCARATGASA